MLLLAERSLPAASASASLSRIGSGGPLDSDCEAYRATFRPPPPPQRNTKKRRAEKSCQLWVHEPQRGEGLAQWMDASANGELLADAGAVSVALSASVRVAASERLAQRAEDVWSASFPPPSSMASPELK